MKRVRLAVICLSMVSACAGKKTEPELTPAAKAAADLVRSQKLATALQVGYREMRFVPGTFKLGFSPEAFRAGEFGSATVAFVVLPNGRVDRESRTLLLVEGHQIYAKHICDALLVARFEAPPTDERGIVSIFPVFFAAAGDRSRDTVRARINETNGRLRRRLREMQFDDALTWFQARPSCSAIRIGLEPLYGPPPQ